MDNDQYERLELVERDAWLDLFAAAPDDCARTFEIGSLKLGELALLATRKVPMVEFNRAILLGVTPITGIDLDNTLAWLTANAASTWALQIGPSARTDAVSNWLESQTLRRSGTGWAKFHCGRVRSAPASVDASVDVRLVDDVPSAEAFGAIAQTGFGLPVGMASWFAALFGRPGWRLYLAYDGETPVASGAAFAQHGVAWFGIDTTLVDYRRRGAQTALIARRLEEGQAAQVTGFTAETGQPPPGQEATYTSYSNYKRAGFTPAYNRPNYKPSLDTYDLDQ